MFGICESILVNIAGAVCGDVFDFAVNSADEFGTLFLWGIAAQAVLIAVYWAVTYVMLDRKLNLQ